MSDFFSFKSPETINDLIATFKDKGLEPDDKLEFYFGQYDWMNERKIYWVSKNYNYSSKKWTGTIFFPPSRWHMRNSEKEICRILLDET